MEERIPPRDARMNGPEAAPEQEMAALARKYPGLDDLEPYYIDWELIWPM